MPSLRGTSLLGALLLSACTPNLDEIARRTLADAHIEEIELLTDGNGSFSFRGVRSGEPCEGTLLLDDHVGLFSSSTHSTLDLHCVPPKGPEELALPDQADDTAIHTAARCDNEDATACSDLGVYWANGDRGLTSDGERALHLLSRGCDAGSGLGCFNLGVEYTKGRHTPVNPQRAAASWARACDLNYGEGCANLGALWGEGAVVKQDLTKAHHFWSLACSLHSATGCFNLGLLYDQGIGVVASPEKAVLYWKKACDDDYIEGCAYLGLAMLRGRGVAADPVAGRRLLSGSCGHGFEWACARLQATVR